MNKIILFADGACSQNGTWEGGWAYIILNELYEVIEEKSGYVEARTTNQRMELQPILEGLKSIIKSNIRSDVTIYTDSAYCVNTINIWLEGWIIGNCLNTRANADLWQEFWELKKNFIDIKCIHIKGHSGNTLNERCNTLAQQARKNKLK